MILCGFGEYRCVFLRVFIRLFMSWRKENYWVEGLWEVVGRGGKRRRGLIGVGDGLWGEER